jgi:hypothetical protein
MITDKEIWELVAQIHYLDWRLEFKNDSGPYLQWTFIAEDSDTGKPTIQKARKWKLSYHMIAQEIERTAHLALQQAVLHEMNEQYKYKGVAIRHPHMNPDFLVAAMKQDFNNAIVSRPDDRPNK